MTGKGKKAEIEYEESSGNVFADLGLEDAGKLNLNYHATSPNVPQSPPKLEDAGQEVVTTISSAEEQLRGWLAQIHRQHDPHQQMAASQRLRRRLVVISIICLSPFFTLRHVQSPRPLADDRAV